MAFLRISTSEALLARPLVAEEAAAAVSSWLDRPRVSVLPPTDRHGKVLAGLLRGSGARGDLVMDAHLAALAIEHGATLCSTDTDFARFPGLRWENPIAPR